MKILNPLQMNDWEIKKFLRVVLAIQLAIWGAIGLDVINLNVQIIRPLISFIYIIFIPGILILRVLRLHKLNDIETLLYTVGLSLATLMVTGFFMNMVYPFFGISEPISLLPLIITISIIVLILCVLCYIRDKDFSAPSFIEVKSALSPSALFLYIIPFLSIFGTYVVNFYHTNILQMFLISILALLVILIPFDMFIPKKLYPLAVFVIAISLIYNASLLTGHIWGWDIHYEYYLSNKVITSANWDSTIASNTNAMLSIVMLAPIFYNISGMSLVYVFKLVYPLLFSLVPLGLYSIFQKQTDDKIAFLSCFFFMSLFVFYVEMLQLARQQIAELFLVLIILLLIDKNMNKMKRSILLIIFTFSLIYSHYGLSYIFMASLIVVWFLLYFYRQKQSKKMNGTMTSSFVLLYITFAISWYLYISSSSTFNSIVEIGNHISESIFTDFLNPEAAQGLERIMTKTISPFNAMSKYLHLLAQSFITIGIITLIFEHKKMKFENEYVAFAYVNFMLLLAGVAIPFVASSLNTSRLYQIALIILSPFVIIGGITVFKIIGNVINIYSMDQLMRMALIFLSAFVAIFLLFNSGFVYEVVDISNSIPLNLTTDYPHYNEQEVLGAKWWYNVKNNKHTYADDDRYLLLGGFEWGINIFRNVSEIAQNSYVFMGNLNIVSGKTRLLPTNEYINSSEITDRRSKIYDNAGAQIYY